MPPLYSKWKFYPDMRILLSAILMLTLSACGFVGFPGVYKIDVEQGNIVTAEMVDQLKPGMSKRQVRFILGTPLVEDTFNQDRWDYPYRMSNGQDVLTDARFTVHFDGDKLATVTGDYLPEWADESAGDSAPADEAETEAEAEASES